MRAIIVFVVLVASNLKILFFELIFVLVLGVVVRIIDVILVFVTNFAYPVVDGVVMLAGGAFGDDVVLLVVLLLL